jgi:ParB/RepB/Spo0J family partition protein
MNAQLLNLRDLIVLDFVERKEPTQSADERDGQSIRDNGIRDPLIAVRDGGAVYVIKGTRRRRLALAAGITKGPVMVDDLPPGQTLEGYIRRMRFILDQHRQDPPPTIRAELVTEMMNVFGFNRAQVAGHLHVNEDTITAWLRVLEVIPPVRAAIDAKAITLESAKVFRGMTPEGQQRVWKHHAKDLHEGAKPDEIRTLYPPTKFPKFYPAEKVKRAKTEPKGKKRSSKVVYDANQKRALLASKERKLEEIEDLKEGNATLEAQNVAAGPLAAAFLRQPKLKAFLSEAVRFELETFTTSY